MQWCVNDLDLICYFFDDLRMYDLLFQLYHICIIDLFADDR